MVAACIRHERPFTPGCPCARLESAARIERAQESVDVPQSSALWHWMGRDRRGDGLLRYCAAICKSAKAVSYPTDRQPPADPGEARLDGQRNLKSSVALAPRGPYEGCWQGGTRTYLDGQAEQCVDGS